MANRSASGGPSGPAKPTKMVPTGAPVLDSGPASPVMEMANVEPVLLMLIKLARDLDEITALHRVAGFEVRTIAPDAQRHAIGRVGQRELAIRFLLAGKFRRNSFELHVDARFERPLRDGLADFLERQQLHRGHCLHRAVTWNSRKWEGPWRPDLRRTKAAPTLVVRAGRSRSRRRRRGRRRCRLTAISGRRLFHAR